MSDRKFLKNGFALWYENLGAEQGWRSRPFAVFRREPFAA